MSGMCALLAGPQRPGKGFLATGHPSWASAWRHLHSPREQAACPPGSQPGGWRPPPKEEKQTEACGGDTGRWPSRTAWLLSEGPGEPGRCRGDLQTLSTPPPPHLHWTMEGHECGRQWALCWHRGPGARGWAGQRGPRLWRREEGGAGSPGPCVVGPWGGVCTFACVNSLPEEAPPRQACAAGRAQGLSLCWVPGCPACRQCAGGRGGGVQGSQEPREAWRPCGSSHQHPVAGSRGPESSRWQVTSGS